MIRKKQSKSSGQAIVEFALILTVLLLMIFLIIESARILQAWITVQNAAREGARYAITGINEPTCPVTGLTKFSQFCSDLRVSSIIDRAHTGLAGLNLDESSTAFEDDYYYQIEVWGVDSSGQLQPYFGGMPNTPVVVRAFYRVPIITPLLKPIIDSVPVFGQATMTNESFGQLGNASQGSGVPPALPPVPTAGVTPSPTPSPTPTDTPTAGPTPTGTGTPTNTPTATPSICPAQFEGAAIAGFDFVFVTGEIGTTVTIVDLNTGGVLGTAVLQAFNGHACPGFNDFSGPGSRFANPLTGGEILLAQSSDGTFDTIIVRTAPPTPTPTSTNTPVPTPTATPSPTVSPTATPSGPFITLLPDCSGNSSAQIQILGANWPVNVSISLYWDSNQLITTIPPSTSQFFSRSYTATGLTGVAQNPRTYNIVAIAATGETYTAPFTVAAMATML
ncbi:MAG: TadE/TadG family type IV pilus assembly protein [Anaerolineae bacterium]